MTNSELSAWLREHYAYELKMLRYLAPELRSERNQLRWNALFESSWLHARSLRDFYTNEKTNHQPMLASSFGVTGIARRSDQQGIFNRMNEQIGHLSKNRSFDEDGRKLTTDDVEAALAWVEVTHAEFISGCSESIRGNWDLALATVPKTSFSGYGQTPSASSSIATTTSPTPYVVSSSHISLSDKSGSR
jgi:hypothetical protein